MMMLELDGRGLVQLVRGHSALKEMPVVVISAVVNAKDVVDLLQPGTTAFLPKPVRLSDLGCCLQRGCHAHPKGGHAMQPGLTLRMPIQGWAWHTQHAIWGAVRIRRVPESVPAFLAFERCLCPILPFASMQPKPEAPRKRAIEMSTQTRRAKQEAR